MPVSSNGPVILREPVVWFVIPYAGEDRDRLDRSLESIEATGAPYWVQHDRTREGVATTLNRAIASAYEMGATHAARLDCGDTVNAERLLCELPWSKGQFCQTYVPNRHCVIGENYDWDGRIWFDNQFCASSTIFPIELWSGIGGYDESLTYCSDWDFAVRMHAEYGWERFPRTLVTAREYPDGLTATADHSVRGRDRATVARRANALRRGG